MGHFVTAEEATGVLYFLTIVNLFFYTILLCILPVSCFHVSLISQPQFQQPYSSLRPQIPAAFKVISLTPEPPTPTAIAIIANNNNNRSGTM
ncbi:hypothetical protein PoB_007549200 [Plakobranchus ocellatus]|uniref:Uncharacterized protein n=1 Tax=Plakobranchus ocellatus TaxID=259542 RepID=A0AAV4DXF9_9GAST|nr:hypothetical protein PoB_007549200 [Plakobranchus ocellatus]